MMRCKVTSSGPKFKFTCESSKLIDVIGKVFTVTSFANCGDGDKHHMIVSYSGSVFVLGHTPETFVAIMLENVESDCDGSFEFDPVPVKGLIKNRNMLEISYDGSRLNFSAVKGRYKANYSTTPVSESQLPYLNNMLKPLKSSSDGSLGGDIVEKIRKGVKHTSLTDFYNSNAQMICFIVAKGKELRIGSWDNFHMAQYVSKVKIPKGSEFKLPISTAAFQLIDKFIGDEKQEAQFFAQSKFLKVQGERFVISLPPVQVESEHFSVIDTYLSSLKNPVGEMTFSKAGTKTVDNMFTISKDDTKLTVVVHPKGKIEIILSTESGSVSDAFKSSNIELEGDKKLEFKVDPRIFADLFRKVGADADLPMTLYSKKNRGVSSSYVINHKPDADSNLVLVGTYYE